MSDTSQGSEHGERLEPPSADAQRKIRCAVAGLGRIASTLETDSLREKPCTHTGAITENPDCLLVGGCDTEEEARERYAADWKVDVFGEIGELLQESRPDIIVVATYPESHRKLTEAAVRAGTPVVICEKPLARTLRDGRAIARLHRAGHAKIIVNHERRYSQDYRNARSIVEQRSYGELLSVRGTLCFGSTIPRREVLLHDGTHLLDVINFLTGSRVFLNRRYGSMRRAEKSAFLFGRSGGKGAGSIPVAIEIGSQRDHLVFEVELNFARGRIRIGNGVYSFERSGESPYYEGYRSLLPDKEAPPLPEKTGYFSGVVADAVRCVREPGRMPLSSAEDALEVMKFIRSV